MDIEKMLEIQGGLDAHIIKQKGLDGVETFPDKVLALQVELAEFANEGRWFKFWKNNQKPNIFKREECPDCAKLGYRRGNPPIHTELGTHGLGNHWYDCEKCRGFFVVDSNPLLEEYVDGLHFFLSIAIQKSWEDCLYIYEEQMEDEGFDGGLTGCYLELIYFLNKSYMENYKGDDKIAGYQKNAYWFRMAWMLFLQMGVNGFGFTLDQIEKAYLKKNEINHQRQLTGY